MNLQLSYSLIYFEIQFAYFDYIIWTILESKNYIFKNEDCLPSLELVKGHLSTLINVLACFKP